MDDQLTPQEAATILQILRQAGPSIRINVDEPEQAVEEARLFVALLEKLKHLAGPSKKTG